mmetsp:Transcript_14191/g.31443  ORF Transcript_14191/g.31443 Transcript_14191/m.31443 type:complete len:270 (-) Transcript_14191:121-930(-)
MLHFDLHLRLGNLEATKTQPPKLQRGRVLNLLRADLRFVFLNQLQPLRHVLRPRRHPQLGRLGAGPAEQLRRGQGLLSVVEVVVLLMFLFRALHQVICDQRHVHVLWMNRFHELLGHRDIYRVDQDTPCQHVAKLHLGQRPGQRRHKARVRARTILVIEHHLVQGFHGLNQSFVDPVLFDGIEVREGVLNDAIRFLRTFRGQGEDQGQHASRRCGFQHGGVVQRQVFTLQQRLQTTWAVMTERIVDVSLWHGLILALQGHHGERQPELG